MNFELGLNKGIAVKLADNNDLVIKFECLGQTHSILVDSVYALELTTHEINELVADECMTIIMNATDTDDELDSHIKVSTKIDTWLETTTWTIDCIYFNCPLEVTLPTDGKGLTNEEINELVANELLPQNKPKIPRTTFTFNSTLGERVANECPTPIKIQPIFHECITGGSINADIIKTSHERLQDTIYAQNKIIFERREALCHSIIVGALEAYGVTLLDDYTNAQIVKLYELLPKDVLDTIANAVHLASLEFTERGLDV